MDALRHHAFDNLKSVVGNATGLEGLRGAAEAGPGDVESRYTKEYEEQLNPFTDFQDKERSARRRQLSPADRLLYEVGQMVSGSRFVVHARPKYLHIPGL